MGARGLDGVGKVIGIRVGFVAEVEPGMRILMRKERIVAADVVEAGVVDDGTREADPALRRHRMSRRTDREQVDHHQLAIVVPARFEKARVRLPAHGEGLAAIEHPWPVHALIDRRGQLLNPRVLKVPARGQYAAKQQGGVDGRKLRTGIALSGFHIRKVIEKPVRLRQMVQVPIERCPYPFHNLRMRQVAAMIGDAQRGQSEARGGDAGHPARIARAIEVVASPVENLPCFGMALFPEKQTALSFKIVQESFILFGQARGIAGGCEAIGRQRIAN